MTMYYSAKEMAYVEMQRMKRILEAAARGEIELSLDQDQGTLVYMKDGQRWQPDMSK